MDDSAIKRRIEKCPQLASLGSINVELMNLLNLEGAYTGKIAEIIKRDSTLTTRLLKIVNSVFFGLGHSITNVEEAVIYIGTRQLRDLAISTPVIEEFQKIKKNNGPQIDWAGFWRHSIGTALVARDLLDIANISSLNETDYIIGLVHDIGKLVIASVFPEECAQIHSILATTTSEVCSFEKNLIGWDHAQIGAYYLELHKLPNVVVEAVAFHNSPEEAPQHGKLSAVIQVADLMIRSVGVPGIEHVEPVTTDSWKELPSWKMIINDTNPSTRSSLIELTHSLNRLPRVLAGLT